MVLHIAQEEDPGEGERDLRPCQIIINSPIYPHFPLSEIFLGPPLILLVYHYKRIIKTYLTINHI